METSAETKRNNVVKRSSSSTSSSDSEDVAKTLFQKGNEAYERNEYRKAEYAYSRALLHFPHTSLKCTIVSNRCAVRLKAGDLSGAEMDAIEACRLNPCWGKAHYRLGCVLKRKNQFAKAWTHFRKAVDMDSKNAVYRRCMMKVESHMIKSGMSEKLKALKESNMLEPTQQFLPNIDLLRSDLVKCGRIRYSTPGQLKWRKCYAEITKSGTVFVSSDALGTDRCELMKMKDWSVIKQSTKHNRTVNVTGMKQMEQKVKIKLNSHDDFLAWMKAIKSVVTIHMRKSKVAGSESDQRLEEYRKETQAQMSKYVKRIDELSAQVRELREGKPSTSSVSLKECREISTLRERNKRLEREVAELRAQLASSPQSKQRATSRDPQRRSKKSSTSSSNTLRLLTNDEISVARDVFARHDHASIGHLSIQTVASAFHDLGLNPSYDELVQMVSVADVNNDGKVSFDEFAKMLCAVECPLRLSSSLSTGSSMPSSMEAFDYKNIRPATKDELREAQKLFQQIDIKQKGSIDSDELVAILSHLGHFPTSGEIDTMIDLADADAQHLKMEEVAFILAITPRRDEWDEFDKEGSDRPYFKHRTCGKTVYHRLEGVSKDALQKSFPRKMWMGA